MLDELTLKRGASAVCQMFELHHKVKPPNPRVAGPGTFTGTRSHAVYLQTKRAHQAGERGAFKSHAPIIG